MVSNRGWISICAVALLAGGVTGAASLRATHARDARTSAPLQATAQTGSQPTAPGQAVGAIQAEFAVDANGGASYTIPIEVPPGTLGVGPALSIAYTSQASDGLLGVGFSLRGLSAITRCEANLRLDGYNGAIRFDAQDRFCLDGERLVKIAGGGGYGDDGSVYHTEHETWTKVTAVGRCGSGPCSFTAQNKDGWTLRFGIGDSATRLPNVAEIAAWQIAAITDLHGNRVTAAYRFDPNTLQNLPREIAYTANDAAGLKAARAVTFDFEPRALAVPRFTGGFRFLVNQRLAAIRTWLDGAEVFSYRLSYTTSAGTGRDLIAAIQQCAGTQCYPPTRIDWQPESNTLQSPNASGDGLLRTNWCTDADAVVGWTDFNGDGRPDAHCDTSTGTHRVLLSTGDGLRTPNANADGTIRTGWCGGSGFRSSWADFNGDARADLVCNGRDGTHRVLVSNGSTVTTPNSNPDGLVRSNWCAGDTARAEWGNFNADGRADLVCSSRDGTQRALVSTSTSVTSPSSDPNGLLRSGWCTASNAMTFWGDFDGDHLSDIHCATQAGVQQVLLATGTGLASPNSDPNGTVATGWCAGEDRRRGATDLNNDGLLDSYCSSTDGRHWVMLSTGARLVSPNASGDGLLRSGWCSGASSASAWADFNGDGLSDLLCREEAGRVLALLSTGTALRSPGSSPDGTLRTNWCTGANARAAWADFNGDSLDDVTCSRAGSQYALVHAPGAPDLARTITDGGGRVIELTYRPITDAAVYADGDAVTYPVMDVRSPLHVVSQYVSADGRSGRYAFTMRYRGARTDLQAQRWLGFQQVTTTETATGRNTIVTYRQDYPVTGFVTSTDITDAAGRLLTRATFEPVVLTPYPQVNQVLNGKETNATYTNGAADYVVTKESRYDAFGNLTYQSDESEKYYAVYSCQRFLNDTAQWRLGYPQAQKTTRTAQACLDFVAGGGASAWNPAADLRWSETDYDPVMNRREERAWDDRLQAWIRVSRTFDLAGNALTRTDAAGNVTTYTYDPTFTFPATETSPRLADGRTLTQRYEFHRAFGVTRTRVDANGNTRLTLVDAFGRPTELRGPDPAGNSGDAMVTLRTISYAQDATGRFVETRERPTWDEPNPAAWFYERLYYDGLDRVFREARRSTRNNLEIVTDTEYDTAAREWRSSVPHYANTAPDFVVTTYDLLNRPLTVTTPDGTVQKRDYLRGTLEVRTTEAFGTPEARVTLTTSDPRALRLRMQAPNGGVTTTTYDPVSQPITSTGPTGATIVSTYDSLGRVVKAVDSDRGTATWEFDRGALLRIVTNGAGRRTRFEYDVLLRPTQRTVDQAEGAPAVYTFAYDQPAFANGLGNLTTETGPGFQRERSYTRYELLATEKLTLDGATYLHATAYDPQLRPSQRTFADGSVLRTTRFVDGAPRAFELQHEGTGAFVTYAAYDDYTALGQPLTLTNRNGLRTDFTYYPIREGLGRPRTTVVSRPQNGAQTMSLGYEWNRLNEVTQIARSRGGAPAETDRYARNAMGWLAGATGPSGNETYDYDLSGNVTLKDGVRYRYQPETNKQRDADNGTTFEFDGAGQLARRTLLTTTWQYDHDADGRLTRARMNGQAVDTPLYDADGERLRRVDRAGVVSRYIASDSDTVETNGAGPDGTTRLTKYIAGLDGLIASVTTTRSIGKTAEMLRGQRALREAALYDPHRLAGIGPWTLATARGLALRAAAWIPAAFALLLLCATLAATIGAARRMRTRARGRRAGRSRDDEEETTDFARQHPGFGLIVPALIASLLAMDVAQVQAQLGPGNGYPTAGTLYFHGDQVDSTVLVTTPEGQESSRVRYDPYGAIDPAGSSGPDNFRAKFASRERDAATGLDYFGARYYDSSTGRFLEPDPQAQFASPYVYASNSPLDQVDPSGEISFAAVVIIAAIVGAVAGAYTGGAAVNHTMNPFVWDWSSGRTLAGILAGAGIGAVGGALGPVIGLAGVAPGIAAEVAIGVVEGAAFSALGGGSGQEILEGALLGGVMSGISAGIGAGLSSAMSRSASSGARAAQRAERQVLSQESESIQSAVGSVCSSFPAGTLVATASSQLQPIEQVRTGLDVLGKAEASTPAAAFPVTSTLSRNTTEFVDVVARGTTVRTTPEHPFWVDGKGWTPARALTPDDRVLAAGDRFIDVDRATPVRTSTPTAVFNFEVGDAHTYYVSPLQLLVHNPSCVTRSQRKQMLAKGHDTLNIIDGVRTRRPPARYGAPIRRYGPAAPNLPGGRFVDFGPVAVRTLKRFRLRGQNYLDFSAADTLAGITKKYRKRAQLVWHHVEDLVLNNQGQYEATMLLVPKATHTKYKHWGGEWRYRQLTGGGYGQ